MGISKQQKQTKNFFEKYSKKWHTETRKNSKYFVNVIKQRHDYTRNLSSKLLNKNAKTLDVGCGTGDLVISLLQKGFDSYGIDFSSSMIKKAKTEAKLLKLSADRFILNSFFKFATTKKFDFISANGFIEYISENELKDFISRSYKLLEKHGILVIGSRNRLFNVFSFNDYTKEEIKGGYINSLLEECILFNNYKNLKNLLMQNYIQKSLQNLRKHGFTGVNVNSRYQYTPCQLITMLKNNGFEIIDLYPIHIHLFTTSAKLMQKELHDYLSNKIQNQKDIHLQLIPQSSSFMVAAKKK